MEKVNHLGIIPDGSRRWSRKNGQSLYEGYLHAMHHLRNIMDVAFQKEVQIISVYGLSKENLRRETDELQAVLDAEGFAFRDLLPPLCEKWNCSVHLAGNIDLLPVAFRDDAINLAQKSASYTERKMYFLLAYNPWDEIQQAVIQGVDISQLQDGLWVKEPLDLVIRTAGGQLLSNFLPLQSGYAELCFFEEYFNDLRIEDVIDILAHFPANGNKLLGK